MSAKAMQDRELKRDLQELELQLIGIDLILTTELDRLRSSSEKEREEPRRPKRPNP